MMNSLVLEALLCNFVSQSTNGRVLYAEFQNGHASGLGILYDKTNKVLSKGIWKDGNITEDSFKQDEDRLKKVEQTAKQYNDRSYEDSYAIAVTPIASKQNITDTKSSKLLDSKSERNEINSSIKESFAEDRNEKTQAKVDGKVEIKKKDTSKSKDTKKKIKKKDVDD